MVLAAAPQLSRMMQDPLRHGPRVDCIGCIDLNLVLKYPVLAVCCVGNTRPSHPSCHISDGWHFYYCVGDILVTLSARLICFPALKLPRRLLLIYN